MKYTLFNFADLPVPSRQKIVSLAASAAQCTRCNACARNCPAYLVKREEMYSPRGRVQFIRLLAEQKVQLQQSQTLIKNLVQSCLLCAHCSASCAGQIPTAHFMLLLRRRYDKQFLPKWLYRCLRLYGTRPKRFKWVLYFFQFIRKTRISKALALCPSLRWLKHADEILPRKLKFLNKKSLTLYAETAGETPEILYLSSLAAQYIDADISALVLKTLQSKKVQLLPNAPSGFFETVYGKQSDGLRQARKLLRLWEKYTAKHAIPLVTDSIEIYSFLKNYPSLFSQFPRWQKRAQRFAGQVHFIADYMTVSRAGKESAALDASGALYSAPKAKERAEKILKTHFGKNLLQCEYSRFPLPAAAEAFLPYNTAKETVLENVKDIARKQIRQIYCLSFWSALELDVVLRHYYPAAKASHIIYLQVEP